MIKFSYINADNTSVSIADADALTISGDFAIGFAISFNGIDTNAYQMIFRTGANGSAGVLSCMWAPLADATRPGKFYFRMSGSTNRCDVGPVELGQSYIVVIQRTNGIFVSKLCPILATAPANGAAVLTGLSYTSAADLNGDAGLVLGSDSIANRRMDQSLGRWFRAPRALTDFEIAQLAYGKEISSIVAPLIYLKMDSPTTIADTGTMANVVSFTGALGDSADPAYGFDSSPTAPTINGKPVISGSPTPTVATSYIQAGALGNPSPAVTQQWTLDGVDIAGATGATYTPVAGDVDKLLRVRQIASNGVGSPATSTSDPAVVAAGAVTLTPTEFGLAEFGYEAFFQQVNGVAAVPVSVTYSGAAPAKLEFQLYLPDSTTITKAWADTGLAPNAGTFSGNVPMPMPITHRKKYKISYRTKDAAGNVMFTSPVMQTRFGIGDVLVGTGSSSMAAWFSDGSGTGMIVNHDCVTTGAQEYFAPFGTAGQASQMAEYISEQIGRPVAFLGLGLGGSTLSAWADFNSTTFSLFKQAVTLAGGKIAGVFTTCGSNDITGVNGAISVQAHLDLLRQLATNIRTYTGQPNLPILLSGINRRTNANSEAQANNARMAERLFGNDLNNYHVQTLDFELSGDGTHLTGAGYKGCCDRVRYVWVEGVKNGIDRSGPEITSLRFSGSEFNAQLSHHSGNDFVPLTGITGFVVEDEKTEGVFTPVTILSCTRTNATNIRGVCDQVLVKPRITYLAGMGPAVGTQVFDNGPLALPMTAEAFMATTAGAIEQPLTLVPYYNDYTIDYAIIGAGGAPQTGSFTTYQLTSSGTLRATHLCDHEWRSGGEIGATAGTASLGTTTTDAQGRLTVTGLPLGPGYMLMKFEDGGVAYQEGVVN